MTELFGVGQGYTGLAIDGQKDGWMLEGVFLTEQEAIDNCTNSDWFVVPIPVGKLMGNELPDSIWWPKLQSKEEGLARLEKYRYKTPEICTNCFEADAVETSIKLDFLPVAVMGMKCPKCDYTVFTHEQSLVIDAVRRANP